jgi:glycosyltransferase involved in cell wall biosynthesis
LGNDVNTFNIGMLGRLNITKDLQTLLKAFGMLSNNYKGSYNLKLLIAGDGDQMNALVQLTSELQLSNKVIFKGMIEENEIPDFFNKVDLYVHASMGETMSTAIMQAMACKKPIIGSDVPGINNMIINNHNGILVSPSNESLLFKSMHDVITNPALRRNLAESAFNHAVQNYSNQRMFSLYCRVIT